MGSRDQIDNLSITRTHQGGLHFHQREDLVSANPELPSSRFLLSLCFRARVSSGYPLVYSDSKKSPQASLTGFAFLSSLSVVPTPPFLLAWEGSEKDVHLLVQEVATSSSIITFPWER